MAEEKPKKEEADKSGFGIDLSSLQDLALGPTWSSGEPPKATPRKDFDQDDEERRRPRGGPKRDRRGPRPPRTDQQGEQGEQRAQGRPPARGGKQLRGQQRRFERPFEPTVEVNLYPEDAPFKALTQAIKTSCRTYELFEIARLILEKPERFVVVVKPLPSSASDKLYIAVPDGAAFESENEAAEYVMSNYMDRYFDVEEVEVDPPKGNFTVVNKCGITGELLGPPNYHRYQQFLQQHHASRLPNTSFERFQSRIESVRDPEAISAWLEKMRKQTRLRLKEGEGVQREFDNLETARFHLMLHNKDKVVRETQTARFPGKNLEKMPANNSVRKSVESYLELQRRFPLDTANNLRGRLRRMNFSVYKKGSKGVSYVCAVKRQFRMPGQTFSESLQQLIDFIQEHPNFQASNLPKEYLGVELPEGGEQTLSTEDQERLRQLRADLRWLISSGYVTEYSDGRLYAPEARDTGNPDQSERDDAEQETEVDPDDEILDPGEAVQRVESEEQPASKSEEDAAKAGEIEAVAEVVETRAAKPSEQNTPASVEQKEPEAVEENAEPAETGEVSEKKVPAQPEDLNPQVSTTRQADDSLEEGKAVAGQNAEVEPVKGEELPDQDTPGVRDEPTPEDHNKQERDPNDGDPGKAVETQDPNKV